MKNHIVQSMEVKYQNQLRLIGTLEKPLIQMELLLNHSKKITEFGPPPQKAIHVFSSLCCHHLHYSTQLLKLHGLEPNLLTWQRKCWVQASVLSQCKGRCWSSCKSSLPTYHLHLPVDPSWWAGDAEPVFLPQLCTSSFMSKASTFAKAKRWADTSLLLRDFPENHLYWLCRGLAPSNPVGGFQWALGICGCISLQSAQAFGWAESLFFCSFALFRTISLFLTDNTIIFSKISQVHFYVVQHLPAFQRRGPPHMSDLIGKTRCGTAMPHLSPGFLQGPWVARLHFLWDAGIPGIISQSSLINQPACPASPALVGWSWWSIGNSLQHTPAPKWPREAYQSYQPFALISHTICQRFRLQLLSGFRPLCTEIKRLICEGCQITFPGTVRFFKCIPVGCNFFGSCFRRKGHERKLQKRKWKTEIITLRSQNQTWFLQHQPSYPHTKGNPLKSDLRGVCMALSAGERNPPRFGVVVPEVNAQLEQHQTVLTRAVKRRDWKCTCHDTRCFSPLISLPNSSSLLLLLARLTKGTSIRSHLY